LPNSIVVIRYRLSVTACLFSANGAIHFQPGATPQGAGFQKEGALKARINRGD
jgi:hypothetical protein